MNIIVTGSAGFIGSAFVRMLLGKSLDPKKSFPTLPSGKVVCLDLLTYAGCLENLDPVKDHPQFKFSKGDIGDKTLVESLVNEFKIEAIVNFAAESHVDRSIEGSKVFAETNILGTLNLLEIAKVHQLKYLQVSTDEVYGSLQPGEPSFTETTPLAPNSAYSASKAGADFFVRAYVETHHLDAIITRCTNNYGPYQFPEKFLPLSMTRLFEGKKIPVYGNGKNIRDWLHVEDHCDGIWLALTKGKSGNVYNFGGFGERSNLEMAQSLLKLCGAKPDQIEYVTDRKGHDFRYSVDPKKSTQELGWKPRWSLDEGLQNMVDWYRTHQSWWKSKTK